MNKKKAGELLGKFWSGLPEFTELDESIYLIDLFIEYIYGEGYEVAPIEFVSNGVDK